MEPMEMNNMYINMGVSNGSENWTEKNHCGNRRYEVRLHSVQLIIVRDTACALIFETVSLGNNFIKIVA